MYIHHDNTYLSHLTSSNRRDITHTGRRPPIHTDNHLHLLQPLLPDPIMIPEDLYAVEAVSLPLQRPQLEDPLQAGLIVIEMVSEMELGATVVASWDPSRWARMNHNQSRLVRWWIL